MNFKKDGNKETITVEVPRFDKGNKSHTATATVTGRLVYLDLVVQSIVSLSKSLAEDLLNIC